MKELSLAVSIDEGNLILEGLGQLPFVKVYALIAKIQQQAKAQADRRENNHEPRVAASAPVVEEN